MKIEARVTGKRLNPIGWSVQIIGVSPSDCEAIMLTEGVVNSRPFFNPHFNFAQFGVLDDHNPDVVMRDVIDNVKAGRLLKQAF